MANCPPNPQSGIRRPIIAQYHGRVTGNLNESIRNLQTWTEVYSKDMTPWGNLAARQIQIGRPDLAIVPAMQALALAPKDPWIYVTLARAQMQSGQTDKALATCRRAIAQGLDGWETHELLAQLAFARHDMATMAAEFAWANGKPSQPDMTEWEMLADFAQGKRRAGLEASRQSADGYKKQGMEESANLIEASVPRMLAELGWTGDARYAYPTASS